MIKSSIPNTYTGLSRESGHPENIYVPLTQPTYWAWKTAPFKVFWLPGNRDPVNYSAAARGRWSVAIGHHSKNCFKRGRRKRLSFKSTRVWLMRHDIALPVMQLRHHSFPRPLKLFHAALRETFLIKHLLVFQHIINGHPKFMADNAFGPFEAILFL